MTLLRFFTVLIFSVLSSVAMASGYQQGCWETGCDDFYVSSGYQLGCWDTGCDDFYISNGYNLVCDSKGCETKYGVASNIRDPAHYRTWYPYSNFLISIF
ncbi:MAG: hypothetical protein ACAH59_03920 [Pseudobdellovibrionaceae bacterium]